VWKFVFISGFLCCEQDWLQLVLSLNLGPGTIKNIEGDSCFALLLMVYCGLVMTPSPCGFASIMIMIVGRSVKFELLRNRIHDFYHAEPNPSCRRSANEPITVASYSTSYVVVCILCRECNIFKLIRSVGSVLYQPVDCDCSNS
jgi:hypothetical protein